MRVDPRPGTHILWLLVSIIVLISGVSSVLSYRHAEQSDDRVGEQALERVVTTAAAVDEYLDQRVGVLRALATAPVFVTGTPDQQDAYFARVDLEAVGFGGGLGLISLDGTMTAFANSTGPDETVDVSGRGYFQAVLTSSAPNVGEAVEARPSGNLVIPIAVPVLGLDGAMSGVLVGALRLDKSGDPPLLRILNPDSTVVDRSGQVIVERGAIPALRSVSESPVYRALAANASGVDDDAVDLSGTRHQLLSHAPVGTGGWLIVSASPRSEAFGAARRQLLQELAIKGLLALLAIVGVVTAARHLDRAAESVARSAAVSAAQSRVLERIALRHPLDEVVESIRSDFGELYPTASMRDRLLNLTTVGAANERAAVAGVDPRSDATDGSEARAVVIAAHLVDIAVDQDRSSTEVLRSERRYRALVEANSAAVWRFVPGRPHSDTSPWWRELTGQELSEMDGKRWLEAVHPQDRDRTAAMWADNIAAGLPFADSFRVRSAIGEYRHLDIRGVPVPSEEEGPAEWIGTYVDVTEERRQDEALRISEERQRLALEAANLGSWDWDLATGKVAWSPVVERQLGLAPGAFDGTIETVRSFVHPDDREYAAECTRAAFEIGEPYSSEFRMIRADGSIRWSRTTGLVIRDWTGAPVRLLGIDVDITEDKARQTERQLFLASVAHDLKNPIAVLKASAQLLQRRLARGVPLDTDEAKARLAVIESNATHLARRLDDLSDLSLLEAGQTVDLNVERVDLVEVASFCVETGRRATVAHDLRLVSNQRSIVGWWDGTRIERVLDNLISNAIRYSPDGGEITVRLWSDQVNAYASVADRGIGVPASDRATVFQFRQRGSNVGKIGGSGVGLAGAARLVEITGGDISIAEHDGPGTTFVVRLPLVPADGSER